jgi:ABC-type antimicrobial peptide transport system permease subunit
MVLARTLRVTALGIAVGLVLSMGTTQLLRRFLHGLSPLDPFAFAASSLAWIGIAMLASYVPSRRATRVNPTVALRYE